MSKAIQVYDEYEKKVVDIPEDEVENVECIRKTYFLIHKAWKSASEKNISDRTFISGLLKFADKFVEQDLKKDKKKWKEVGKIWELLNPNISKALHTVEDELNEENSQREFQKPFDQLSDAEKKVIGDVGLTEGLFREVLTYHFICRSFDIWTPYSNRVDAVAYEIQKTEIAEAEKEKAKAEKRVPLGN